MSNLPSDPLTRTALGVYSASLIGEALQGYAVAGVSFPWLAQVLTIGFALILLLQSRYVRVAGFGPLALLLAWGTVVTLANAVSGEFEQLMPFHATTSYPMYVTLRLVVLCGFAAQVYLVSWLLSRGCMSAVIARTTTIATVIAVIAIYIYFAQLNGWPVPVKTRLGTDGGEQKSIYSYAFHRATGTFQEPGDLAAWLVFPFFLGFLGRGRLLSASSALISAALLLSGSLAAIVGSLFGCGFAIVFIWPLRHISPARILQMCLAAGAAAVIFSFVAVANEGGSTDLVSVLTDRLKPIMDDGVQASNRDYIYNFVADTPIPPFGVGFGNSNLILTVYHGSSVIVSFLSAYFVILYSTGYVGMLLFVMCLLAPLKAALNCRLSQNLTRPAVLMALTATYSAYALMVGFRAEELPMSFGTVYAMLVFASEHYQAALQALES
jgi:hypothetical protein